MSESPPVPAKSMISPYAVNKQLWDPADDCARARTPSGPTSPLRIIGLANRTGRTGET